MPPEDSRYDRGLTTMQAIFGRGIESALKGLAAASPDLVRCLVEFSFGDIYPRPSLDLKTREMLTVAALTVLGQQSLVQRDGRRGLATLQHGKMVGVQDYQAPAKFGFSSALSKSFGSGGTYCVQNASESHCAPRRKTFPPWNVGRFLAQATA